MPRWFVKYRSEDDESAPLDYSYVGSVAEGARRKHAEPIHREAADATVSRRAVPDEPAFIDDYRAPRAPAQRSASTVAGGLPSAESEPAPVTRVAYPRPRNNAFAETPTFAPRERLRDDTPYDWNAGRSPRANARGASSGQPTQQTPDRQHTPDNHSPTGAQARSGQPAPAHQPLTGGQIAMNGQFAPPVSPEVPDWLRISQQNNLPLPDEHRRRSPRVQAAPRVEPQQPVPTDMLGRPIRSAQRPQPVNVPPQSASGYAEAGYPPELIEQQRMEEQQEREQARRLRHGAQYAVNPERLERERLAARQPETDPRSYPPPRSAAIENRRARRRGDERYPDENALADEREPAPENNNPYVVSRKDERWQDDESDEAPVEERRLNVPWLGITVAVLALLCVGLWIGRMTFAKQTEAVLNAREQQAASLFDDHPYRYRELVETQASANNLHPAFVAAIILNESSFNPSAESNVGARGLMQMTSETFDFVHGKLSGDDQTTFDAMYNADTNVQYACWYLAFLSGRFHGDPILVAAAFHAGPSTVQNWLNDSRYSADSRSITLENMMDGPTKNYASRVLNAYAVYKRLYYETTSGGTT